MGAVGIMVGIRVGIGIAAVEIGEVCGWRKSKCVDSKLERRVPVEDIVRMCRGISSSQFMSMCGTGI